MRPSASTTSAPPGSMPLLDGDDPAVADADVGGAPRRAGAVDDGPAPNHPVELAAACLGHARPPRSPPRRYLTRVSGSPSGVGIRPAADDGGVWEGWRPMIRRLWDRPERKFFARAVPRVTRLRHRVVGACSSCGVRCPPCSPSPPARSSAPSSAGDSLAGPLTFVGVVFVAVQVLSAAAPGGQRQPRQPDRRWLNDRLMVACTTPAGHRAPRAARADQRPDRGPRLRPRHHRPAALDLDGLHRQRPRRDGRRPRRRGRPVRLHVVGAARAARRRGARRTGCCARAACGGTATPTRSAPRSATPTTPTGSPSTRRRPRRCGCSAWPTGSSTASAATAARLYELQWEATRLRERSVLALPRSSCSAANARRALGDRPTQPIDGRLDLADAIVFLQTARRRRARSRSAG